MNEAEIVDPYVEIRDRYRRQNLTLQVTPELVFSFFVEIGCDQGSEDTTRDIEYFDSLDEALQWIKGFEAHQRIIEK